MSDVERNTLSFVQSLHDPGLEEFDYDVELDWTFFIELTKREMEKLNCARTDHKIWERMSRSIHEEVDPVLEEIEWFTIPIPEILLRHDFLESTVRKDFFKNKYPG